MKAIRLINFDSMQKCTKYGQFMRNPYFNQVMASTKMQLPISIQLFWPFFLFLFYLCSSFSSTENIGNLSNEWRGRIPKLFCWIFGLGKNVWTKLTNEYFHFLFLLWSILKNKINQYKMGIINIYFWNIFHEFIAYLIHFLNDKIILNIRRLILCFINKI